MGAKKGWIWLEQPDHQIWDRSPQEIGVGGATGFTPGSTLKQSIFNFPTVYGHFSLLPPRKFKKSSGGPLGHFFDLGATACMVWSQPRCSGTEPTGCLLSEGLRDGHLEVCLEKLTEAEAGRL